MRNKITDVIAAARTFVRSSNPDDEMFVVNFNEHVTLGLPSEIPFTNRLDQLEAGILKASVTGQTALYDAVAIALERLQGAHRDKKVLVVISDGADNASKRSLAEVLTKAGQSSALIYAIGIFEEGSRDRNPRVLKQLVRATGGEAFFPGQFSEVLTICETIARDIRHQYTLGYLSTSGAQSGAYRSIRVVAGPSGSGRLTVRTRAGYVAGGDVAK
jgi:Ca-activated chloride channel family protein